MSFKRYPEYKDSGVEWLGFLPANWTFSKIKYNTYVKGRVGWHGLSSDEFSDSGVHLVTGTDFIDGFVNWESCYRISEERYAQDPYIQLKENDLLITKDGTIGKLALVKKLPERATLNSGIFLIRAVRKSYLEDYLYWILQSNVFEYFMDLFKTGSTIQHLYQEVFNKFCFPIPPNYEQQKICDFLDRETAKIDALVEEQKRLIELLKEKRQAVISHAVTKGLDPNAKMKDSGVEWLGMVPEGWEVCGFTKYLDQIIDYRGKTPAKTEIGIQLITARNIKDGIIDYEISQEYIAEDDYSEVMSRGTPTIGDVLFTMEAPLGQVANVNRTDIALAQRIVKFRGKSGVINNYYLKYWIMSTGCQSQLEQLATGSTALGIKSSKLGQIQFCYPSIDEQTIIVKYLDESIKSFEGLMIEAQQAVDILQERRTALISAAVTGKIDVRDLTPNPSPERRGEHVGVSECYERG